MSPKAVRSARAFVPADADLARLKKAVQDCRGCDLYRYATQAVFGEGPENADLMLIGEIPGDQEDIEGKPFVGPAGKVLHKAMEEAGIAPEAVYITNVVKHFKFEQRGSRRYHKKPTGPEVKACRPWLEAEIDLVRPKIIVCLGATAAQALMGSGVRVTRDRGKFREFRQDTLVTATVHPSALLRMPEEGGPAESLSPLRAGPAAHLRPSRSLRLEEAVGCCFWIF
jgi:uracil-DNA glycosylase family protein